MAELNERPNILFVCVDQWRGDCLGTTGHPVVETPHLDAHGRTGSYFHTGIFCLPILYCGTGINFYRAFSTTERFCWI